MADRVRLSLFCPSCLPGYHLPFFTAVTRGVFADHDLVVDILDPPPPPGTANTHRVAGGGADFGLTGVTYFLLALKEAGDRLPARFVSVIHQRSPLGAIVAEDSDIETAADLSGRRMGRGRYTGWLADECGQALADRGLESPVFVDLLQGDAPYALGRGDVDACATMVDTIAGIAAKSGLEVRAVALGPDVYASGLIAGDGVPTDVVERMRQALFAAFALQEADPASAVAEFCERFPDVLPSVATAGWAHLQSYAAAGAGGVGAMDAVRWAATVDWVSRAHGLPPVAPERVHRPELAS
jgi:ABC-type nitrate/sulfonate/bicarbonate transport system substrate-binding protein